MGGQRTESLVVTVVLNWNNFEATAECLKSLVDTEYENHEILVVDNHSTDDSPERIREEFPTIHFHRTDHNGGYAYGNNAGIEEALDLGAAYVFVLNNDTNVAPDTVGNLVDTLEDNEEAGIAAPMIYYYDQPNTIQACGSGVDIWKANTRARGHLEEDTGQFNERTRVEHANGAAMMINRAVFDEIGLLDEEYGYYTEDLDFSHRATEAGFEIIAVPDATIWHKVSASTGSQSPFVSYYTVRSKLIFARKHVPLRLLFLFAFYYVYFVLWRIAGHLRHGNRRTATAVLLGVYHGLRGQTGIYDPITEW